MRISVTIFVILISTCIVKASVLDPVIENVVHLKASKPPSEVPGIWKKKTIWKPRWIKEWKSAKVMKPVWKKVWSPVHIREWVPIPKPPPGWNFVSTPLAPVRPNLAKTPIKDFAKHDSLTIHTSTTLPLWDPVPYPESQQPPPPPPPPLFSQTLHIADSSCGKNGCDNYHSETFSHQQISEVIGPRYNAPDYLQTAEYSETVNHLSKLPPEGNTWRPPQPLPNFHFDNHFNNFPGLPEFLVPPKFQTLPDDFRSQLNSNEPRHFNSAPIPNGQGSHSSGFEGQNGLRQRTTLPPETKTRGHFITKAPNHSYKFKYPEVGLPAKNNTETFHKVFPNPDNNLREKPNLQTHDLSTSFRTPTNGDFIQEAQLIGEYHYSEFDLPDISQESRKPEHIPEEGRVGVKPQQKIKAMGLDAQKLKTSHQIENKERQNRTETETEVNRLNSQHIQKKHIANSWNASHTDLFDHQKAILKEIFQTYNTSLNVNDPFIPQNHRFASSVKKKFNYEKPINQSSTKLLAGAPESNFHSLNVGFQQQKENYPVYERPKIPPNHRFSPLLDFESPNKPFTPSHHTTRLVEVASHEVPKTENPPNVKNNSVQLVFPMTSVDSEPGLNHKHSGEDSQKTTTTEPFSVVFSSSLLSTTDAAVTRSPVIIVTPVNLNGS